MSEAGQRTSSKKDKLLEQLKKNALFMESGLLGYFRSMHRMSTKVHRIFESPNVSNIGSMQDMSGHVKICAEMSNYWASSVSYLNLLKTINFYFDEYLPIAQHAPVEVRKNYARFGTFIAGIALIEGDYYVALQALRSLVALNENLTHNMLYLMNCACFLKEWDVFLHYYKMFKAACKASLFVPESCHLCFRFHTAATDDEKKVVLVEVEEYRKTLESAPVKTVFLYSALSMLYSILTAAGNLEHYNLRLYLDSVTASLTETTKASTIMHPLLPFYDFEKPLNLYESSEGLPNCDQFLKTAAALFDMFEKSTKHVFYLHQCGMAKEAEQKLALLLLNSMRMVSPYRMLTTFAEFYYLKCKTICDRGKLKGLAACLSLLLSSNSKELGEVEHRKLLMAGNYVGQIASDSESFIPASDPHHGISIISHPKQCGCVVCLFGNNNPVFKTLQSFAEFLLGSDVAAYEKFDQNAVSIKDIACKRKRAIEDIDPKFVNSVPVSQIACYYYCLTTLKHLMDDREIIGENRCQQLCDSVIEASSIFIEYKCFYLLARQLVRYPKTAFDYPWLDPDFDEINDIDAISDSFKFMDLKNKLLKKRTDKKAMSTRTFFRESSSIVPDFNCLETIPGSNEVFIKQNVEVFKARADFRSYAHLMYSDWRSKICLYLGSWLAEAYPWYSALYFIESQASSLRQHVRMMRGIATDMRFREVSDLRNFVCSLPEDLTVIQLVLDEADIIWLIRIDLDSRPLVLPLRKINVTNDIIMKGIKDVLIANDQSVAENSKMKGAVFWKNRHKVDEMLRELIQKMERTWLSYFRPLLLPSGKFGTEMLHYLNQFCSRLVDAGYCECHAKVLTRTFLNAQSLDFQRLLKVFGMLQKKKKEISTPNFQKKLYRDLVNVFGSDEALQEYKKSEKYTMIIIPPVFNSLPWEFLPIYEESPYVLRIHSLNFLKNAMKNFSFPHLVNPINSFYLLNPGNDLPETELRMINNLNLDLVDGMTQNCPSRKEIAKILATKDLFFYIGHGSGSRHFGRSTIRETQCQASVILMGCSSVRLTDEGRGYDGICMAHSYAIAGSPCVIGCLWMVTDGEIDRFFISLIKYCFEQLLKTEQKTEINEFDLKRVSTRTLMRALVKARSACKLRYLTGAAVVAYGVPIMSSSGGITRKI